MFSGLRSIDIEKRYHLIIRPFYSLGRDGFELNSVKKIDDGKIIVVELGLDMREAIFGIDGAQGFEMVFDNRYDHIQGRLNFIE